MDLKLSEIVREVVFHGHLLDQLSSLCPISAARLVSVLHVSDVVCMLACVRACTRECVRAIMCVLACVRVRA